MLRAFFSLLFFVAVQIFFASPAFAVTTYEWTHNTFIPSVSATSSALRNVGLQGERDFLVYSYVTDERFVSIATSTNGTTWSSPISLGNTPVDKPILSGKELATSIIGTDYYGIFAQTADTSYLFGYSFDGQNVVTPVEYVGLQKFSNPDVAFFLQESEVYGLLVLGNTQNSAGDTLFTVASTTGEFFTDTFTSSTRFLGDSSRHARSDAEYTELSESTELTLAYFSTEDDAFGGSEFVYPQGPYSDSSTFSGGSLHTSGFSILQGLEVDGEGQSGIAFLICNTGDAEDAPGMCGVYFSTRSAINTYSHNQMIVPHVIPYADGLPQIALTSSVSGYPVIIYSQGSVVKYAMKDPSGSGNGACEVSTWSCGVINTVEDGSVKSLAVAPMNRVNSDRGSFVVTYSDEGGVYSSYGLIRAAATTPGSAFPKTVAPKSPRIIINNGSPFVSDRVVSVKASAEDATYVALSTTSDFINSAWQEISGTNYITLPEFGGEYTIYAKFSNTSGGVSEVVSSGVVYEPKLKALQAQVASILNTFIKALEEAVAKKENTENILTNQDYEVVTSEPFVPGYLRMLERNADEAQSSKPAAKYSCAMRPNAFSLGGKIIRDSASKKLYMVSESQKSACEVVSSAVARSWGVVKFPTGSISGYELSTPLPYKPGTVIVDSKTGTRYFANSAGELHKFPSLTQYRALGYSSQAFHYDTAAAITRFNRSADLTRRDIHPDGTMFVLDKKKGEYAILHNRTLHRLTVASIKKYGERAQRAIPLLKSETYPEGDRWDP